MENTDQSTHSKKDPHNNNIIIDEKTDTKIHEHLSNKNDIISEQDIESAAVNLEPTINEALPESNSANEIVNNKKGNTKNDEEEKEEPSVPIITPWNVIG